MRKTARLISVLPVILGMLVFPVLAASGSTNLLTQANLIDGSEIGVWETDGGPALTNSTVTGDVTATKTPVIRYGVYDCFTDETCGTDSHTGTLSKTTFETTVSGIVNTLHAVPWIKLVPVTKGAIGGVSNGSVFCPSSSDWGMNLAMDEEELSAISSVYKGPIILESSNEAEYDCYSSWGFSSAGSAGVSTDIAKMYEATMPALKTYAQGLGFSQVVNVGYIGINGGLNWGQTCTAGSGTYGYTCTAANRWIDEFNSTLHTDGYSPPDVESVHSYCHSSDNASNPYSFDDNICYALQREWITNARAQVDSIWGSTAGDGIRFAVSEWQAGVCTNTTSSCWSGFSTSGAPGSYDDGYLSMLAGNGVTTGTGTAYWAANLFEWASNCSGASSAYNIANCDGTTPDWYSNIKSDFLATQGASPCAISVDASSPPEKKSVFGAGSLTTASFTPPAGSLLAVSVDDLQGTAGGDTVTVSDSAGDTYTAGPHISGTTAKPSLWSFETYLSSSPGALTVTASQSGTHLGSLMLNVRVLDNASQVQAGAAAATHEGAASASQASSVTTTAKGSWVMVQLGNNSATDTLTANSGTTNIANSADSTAGAHGAIARSASSTVTPGSTSFGYTSTVSSPWDWSAQEVLPAAC